MVVRVLDGRVERGEQALKAYKPGIDGTSVKCGRRNVGNSSNPAARSRPAVLM